MAARFDNWGFERRRKSIDSSRSREKIKSLHLLAKHGARWVPADKSEVNSARRSLLKLEPDYTVEFVWIMSRYNGCTHDCAEDLLRTPSIKSHVSAHRGRIAEILSSW